ncbi:MAG: hypothetical protein ACK40G_02590 [Cytophagaceae bacterium]
MVPHNERVSERVFSKICVNEKGELCEMIAFEGEIVEIRFNCLREHLIYGICFAYNPKFDNRRQR